MTPSGNSPTRFGLLRHAPTLWNRDGRLQGQSDSPLTLQGRALAGKWGAHLKDLAWNRILASDLGRAAATAALVNAAIRVPVSQDVRLREQNWGLWTGLSLSELKRTVPALLEDRLKTGWGFCPPEGESRVHVRRRSQEALEDAAAKWPGETILVITHEGVIKCLIYRLCGRKFLPTEPPMIRTRHLHWLIHDGQGLRVEKINAFKLASEP